MMIAMSTSVAQPRQLEADRLRRLLDELRFALARTDTRTLREWGGRSAGRLVTLTGKRVGALAAVAKKIGRASVEETKGMAAAAKEHRFGEHFGDRTAAAIDGTISIARGGSALVGNVGRALADDPKTNAPKVLAAFLGFYAGSGGIDGDGGIPDLDLLAGIDAHRSLLTHSIIAGVLAEGLLLAMVDLSAQVGDKLPIDHDPLWDKLAQAASPLAGALTTGASAGIAYHLLWDASIEPAPYHGLPFEMSMEAHQAAMAANGAAEGAYAARQRTHQPVLLAQDVPAGPTTGRKVVDGVAGAANTAGQFVRGFWAGLTGKS